MPPATFGAFSGIQWAGDRAIIKIETVAKRMKIDMRDNAKKFKPPTSTCPQRNEAGWRRVEA